MKTFSFAVLVALSMPTTVRAQGSTLLNIDAVTHDGTLKPPVDSARFRDNIFENGTIDFSASSIFDAATYDISGNFIKFDVVSRENHYYYRSSTFNHPNFRAFGDLCDAPRDLAPGVYDVTAVLCFPNQDVGDSDGCFGVPENRQVVITNGFGISDFVLVDGDTDADLTGFNCQPYACRDGATKFNIRADFFGNVKSVRLSIDGPVSNVRVENVPPYALFGDINSNYAGVPFPTGTYTVSAQAFTGNGASGEGSPIMTYEFRI